MEKPMKTLMSVAVLISSIFFSLNTLASEQHGKAITNSYGPQVTNLAILSDAGDESYPTLGYVIMDQAFDLRLEGCDEIVVENSKAYCEQDDDSVLLGTLGEVEIVSGDMASPVAAQKLTLSKKLNYKLLDFGTDHVFDYALVIE
jgi:hypothetical protein